MNERAAGRPALSAQTVADKQARADRLAAEMRKNLMKRKQQQRQMAEGAARDDIDQAKQKDPG